MHNLASSWRLEASYSSSFVLYSNLFALRYLFCNLKRMRRNHYYILAFSLLLVPFAGITQNDTTVQKMDSILLSKKGIIGELAQALLDTSEVKEQEIERVDKAFQR